MVKLCIKQGGKLGKVSSTIDGPNPTQVSGNKFQRSKIQKLWTFITVWFDSSSISFSSLRGRRSCKTIMKCFLLPCFSSKRQKHFSSKPTYTTIQHTHHDTDLEESIHWISQSKYVHFFILIIYSFMIINYHFIYLFSE